MIGGYTNAYLLADTIPQDILNTIPPLQDGNYIVIPLSNFSSQTTLIDKDTIRTDMTFYRENLGQNIDVPNLGYLIVANVSGKLTPVALYDSSAWAYNTGLG